MKKKDKTLEFKIVEHTFRRLAKDNETILEIKIYYLYKKVSWFFGKWLLVFPDDCEMSGDDYFFYPEDAVSRAKKVAAEYMREAKIQKLLKEEKLKDTDEEFLRFKIPLL